MPSRENIAPLADDLLLVLDDDRVFRERLIRAMEKRGFRVLGAEGVRKAGELIATHEFTHAICDLRLEDGNGLDIVEGLHRKNPEAAIVVLTGYGAISTAVAAVKKGAIEYLSKPASGADDIYRALMGLSDPDPEPSETPMSADRVRWEHIQSVYEAADRNVSETARRLGMHRRTLQRILAKRAPNE